MRATQVPHAFVNLRGGDCVAAPGSTNKPAFNTVFPGRIGIRRGGVAGRSGYNVFICSGDPDVPANWSHLVFTTRNHFSATDLSTDKVFYFRVNAIGAAGPSGMSDLAWAKAA